MDFSVVGIGASAGGLEAFRQFFEHLPADPGMAFVLILHLPADRKSMLSEIIARWTSMPVIAAEAGTRIQPNHVYVPPPHSIVKLTDGLFTIQDAEEDRQFRPIDDFFDALGTDMRERAVGIVLSGTGTDGALGLKALKERGGLAIAQGTDGSAPQYGDMPAGAIATGVVDIVSPVEEMPGHLLRLRQPLSAQQPQIEQPGTDEARLEICTLLRSQVGHDFSDYRSQTFLRRVGRRMQVTGAATLQDYVQRLKADANELTLLFRDLLIRVTSFFRDSETFDVLAAKVVPRLFEGKGADGVVRVWVPGCATGEETYSLAILLREHMSTLATPPRVQLFGSDIDAAAITIARAGRYPETLVDGLSEHRLRRFFTYSQGSYCVSREIRELCTFSEHNVIRDPPFSMMNLVSCRNLLIYMNPNLQARVLPVFHYALASNGTLLLGGSESVALHSKLFDTLDKSARIFQKRNAPTPELAFRWHHHPAATPGRPAPPTERWNNQGSHFAGGENRGKEDVAASPHSTLADEGQLRRLLEPLEPTTETVSLLQEALGKASSDLRSLAEEHQTALEELRSTNEELHSVNEELQSTNEELETSKEELQSLNEELHTVNLRLSEKVDELAQANSDLRNLFDSTEIATVFLDRHLIIRSFTSAMASLYNLIPSDQGRPLTDIVSRLRYTGMREDVNHVLTSLEILERRVQTRDQKTHYIMRIVPYREPDSEVTGVLVTFTDVSSIVQAEEALMAADVRKDVFLATLSHELRNPLAPIRSAAQLLRLPDIPPEEVKAAQCIIARQVSHMSSLLDDLLDVSRITRSVFLLKKEYVDLGSLMDAAVEAVKPAMDAKQHTLRVERPAVPLTLDVDPVRMTQVITNLLTNAAKYTPPGGVIQLGTRVEPLHIVVYVRDNGIGLTDEAMTRVFDMFARIKDPDDRQEGGLGIGLALARGLMELHGGSLQVHSAGLKRGSEFSMCIPKKLVVAQPEQQMVAEEHAGTIKPRRILVADDNVDNASIMEMLLRSCGHEVRTTHTGTEAWEIASEMRPDVCIFDIGMPGLSGNEVTERIRHEAWGDRVLLIAVTGWGQESDRRKAIAAGFDHHLTKPVDPSVLEDLIDRWEEKPR